MAVASPILERKIAEQYENKKIASRGADATREDFHNSQIRSNYEKLLNPKSTLNDIIVREEDQVQPDSYNQPVVQQNPVMQQSFVPTMNYEAQKPYLVENARADADIFRADSVINQKVVEVRTPISMATEVDEEDNEDLRPTQTTIQYKTAGIKKSDVKVDAVNQAKKVGFTKRDKLVIVAVVSVIVALFVMIIINSAIISSVNSDLNSLQSSLNSAKMSYSEVNDEVQEYMSDLADTVSEFAQSNGMVLR